MSPRDSSTSRMRYLTYQVPPAVGSQTRLYVGETDGFDIPFTLLALSGLPLVGDSVKILDSAFIQLTVDTSRYGAPLRDSQFTLGYMVLDSNYSEAGTNHMNVEWLPEDFPVLTSVLKVDTASGLPAVRFPVDTSWIYAWKDTSILFVLERVPPEESFVTAFFSTEAQSHGPFLKVFSHDTSGSADTTIAFASDVSLIVPPPLESSSFDSLKIYAGDGAGLRSLILPEIEAMAIPAEAVVVRASLILNIDTVATVLSPNSGYELQISLLTDSVASWQWGEVHESDPYPDIFITRASVAGGKVTFDMRAPLQSIVSGLRGNFGFKVAASSSSFVFDYAAFHAVPGDSASPVLEVLYEAP